MGSQRRSLEVMVGHEGSNEVTGGHETSRELAAHCW